MNYIDFVVRNKHIESRQNAIIADNTDYVFRFTFLGKWTEFETKTVLMLREDGKLYRCDMKDGATSVMLPKFTSPLTLLIGVTAGSGEEEISTDRLLFNVRSSIRTGANEELEKPESGAEDFLAEYCRRYDELLLKLETLDDVYMLPSVTSADAGKVLRVSAAGEWEAADGDGDSKPFVVTVTYGDDDTLTADKTHAEIVEAYAAGEQINAKIINYPGVNAPSILPLYVNMSDEMFMFSGSGVLDGSAMAMTAIDTNGSWRVELAELATLGDIPSGGTDTSLGVTGAEVGQIIKIKAVDENGIPTEWEAADAASGEDWEFINEISTNEWISSVTINQDSNGNPFSLKKMRIFMTLPKTTNEAGEEQSNPGYAHYKVNDRNPAWQSPAGYWESGLFLWTIEAFGDYYIVSCWKDGANSSTLHHIDVFHDAGYFESITSFTWKLFNANYGWSSTNFKVYGVKA